MGLGPMTGRRAGYCAGFNAPGFMNPTGALGFAGRGALGGGGRGWRHCYHATGLPGRARTGMGWPGYAYPAPAAPAQTEQAEVEMLRAHVQRYEQALDALRQRLQELEGEKPPAA